MEADDKNQTDRLGVHRSLWLAVIAILISTSSAFAQSTITPPLLVSQPTSTRAIAVDSVTLLREPFAMTSPVPWSPDQRTRIILFALSLPAGAPGLTADAEDASHQHHALTVECVTATPSFPWLTEVVLRLADNLTDAGDVLVEISYQGVNSNRVRVGIGHVGGGPPDDPAAVATPIPARRISGKVSNSTGNGIAGVTITLTGTQAAVTKTDGRGKYAFNALAYAGSYTVTPSIEQDYYAFAPTGQSVSPLFVDQIDDFTATLTPIPNPSQVLEFDGSPKTVDYGPFWPENVNLGHFFWEFWAMPGANAGATYLVSDGYGGAHALLFGVANFGSYEPGRYSLLGNIYDGVVPVMYFGSDQGPAVNEWGHYAVGWDGESIITYFNGVPVGKTAFAGPRRSPSPLQGGGRLMVGGSDHNNFVGRIAQVHGYEGSNPREDPLGLDPGSVETAFVPTTVFSLDGNLLSYYFRSAPRVADLSSGYGGTHAGWPRGTTLGVPVDCGSCPPPQFVADPTAPNFATGLPPLQVGIPALPTIPVGALVFDSFSRANSTYVVGGLGGLTSTEGGTAGVKVWQTSQSPGTYQAFGILNGRGVLLANDTYLTWVPTGSVSGNLDVRVDRHPGVWGSGLDTGVSFRVTDAANYFFACTEVGDHGFRFLNVGYYLNGQRTNLLTAERMPLNWTTLRVLTKSNGDINVYGDATLVYSGNSGVMASASGAGLFSDSSGKGLVNRWDNFTVYAAP